jgi:archaellum component FlaF (FlaF/FlaG flagellin family)
MLRRQTHLLLLVLLALAALTLPSKPAQGMSWRKGASEYFSVQHLCRDGALISTGYRRTLEQLEDEFEDNPNLTIVFTLTARLYTNTDLPLLADPNDDQLSRPNNSEYGPTLSTFSIQQEFRPTQPITVDLDLDGTLDQTFWMYKENTIVTWPRVLNPGQRVIVSGGNGDAPELVDNCFYNRPVVDEGASRTIGSAYLRPTDSFTDPAALTYHLEALPTGGTLRLNSVPLAVGGTFTQADVDANRLSYAHAGGENTSDVFTYTVRATTRVSVRSNGAQATGGPEPGSTNPSISLDGRFVAFESDTMDLVATDTNDVRDVFWHDQLSNTTLRASVRANGSQSLERSQIATISPGGAFVAFESDEELTLAATGDCADRIDGNSHSDAYFSRYDFDFNIFTATKRLSVRNDGGGTCTEPDDDSFRPTVGDFGFPAVFASRAGNLLFSEDEPPGTADVFFASGGAISRLSSNLSGDPANGVSGFPSLALDPLDFVDWVAFQSNATNITNVSDLNNSTDVFVRGSGVTRMLSLVGGAAPPAAANGASTAPAISSSGRYIAYQSAATNIVTGTQDTNSAIDILVHDRDVDQDNILDEAGATLTRRVSVSSTGAQASGTSGFSSTEAAISGGGQFVAFSSSATNLVPNDTNSSRDVFLHDRISGQTTRVSVAGNGSQGNANSFNPAVSADGQYVVFESDATNLVPNDTNSRRDIFVHYVGYTSSFPISITAVNDAPVVTPPGAQNASPGQTLGPLAVSLADPDNSPDSLSLSATSSDQQLLPDANIQLSGSGVSRTITLSLANITLQSTRVVTVTLSVSDGDKSGSARFQIIVQPPGAPQAPTITPPPAQQAWPGVSVGPLAVTLGDPDSSPDSLSLSATSSDQQLLPDANIQLGGSGFNRTITFTPAAAPLATATPVTVTLSVSDGTNSSSAQFTVLILPSDAPLPPPQVRLPIMLRLE